jgi:hypothetical protein
VKWLNLTFEVLKVHFTCHIFCKNRTHVTQKYSKDEIENNEKKGTQYAYIGNLTSVMALRSLVGVKKFQNLLSTYLIASTLKMREPILS